MMRRLFWLSFGLGLGALLGYATVRRVGRAGRALSPAGLGERARDGLDGLAARGRQVLELGREAAAEREAELRAEHDVRSVRDALRRSDGA